MTCYRCTSCGHELDQADYDDLHWELAPAGGFHWYVAKCPDCGEWTGFEKFDDGKEPDDEADSK